MTDHTPALQRPATRTARLSAIEQALLTRIVTSQSQLSQILADQGIEVTQATLSRDLDEIHATKTRLADALFISICTALLRLRGDDARQQRPICGQRHR